MQKKYIKILSKRSCFFALQKQREVLEPDFVLQNRLLILSFVTTPLLEDITIIIQFCYFEKIIFLVNCMQEIY